MFQRQIDFGNMPITLVCLSDSAVALVPRMRLPDVIDNYVEGHVQGFYNEASLELKHRDAVETVFWGKGYYYKEMPLLLQYLKQQNINPDAKELWQQYTYQM